MFDGAHPALKLHEVTYRMQRPKKSLTVQETLLLMALAYKTLAIIHLMLMGI